MFRGLLNVDCSIFTKECVYRFALPVCNSSLFLYNTFCRQIYKRVWAIRVTISLENPLYFDDIVDDMGGSSLPTNASVNPVSLANKAPHIHIHTSTRLHTFLPRAKTTTKEEHFYGEELHAAGEPLQTIKQKAGETHFSILYESIADSFTLHVPPCIHLIIYYNPFSPTSIVLPPDSVSLSLCFSLESVTIFQEYNRPFTLFDKWIIIFCYGWSFFHRGAKNITPYNHSDSFKIENYSYLHIYLLFLLLRSLSGSECVFSVFVKFQPPEYVLLISKELVHRLNATTLNQQQIKLSPH